MDGSSIPYLLSFVLFCLGGAYFAGSEIALASVNRIKMITYSEAGDKRAKRVLYILDNFDKALITLLIGNNIMHIGCATLATVFAYHIAEKSNSATVSTVVTVSTFLTTLVLFFFAEMVPKCFAKDCNEKFSLSISGSLYVLMKLMTPIAFFFTMFSNLVSKPFKNNIEEMPTVTEDELHDIVEATRDDETFDEEVGELVRSALKFSDKSAQDVMTPWESVSYVSLYCKNEEILEKCKNSKHSRLPVVGKTGNVVGILQIRKFIKNNYETKGNFTLRSVLEKVYFTSGDAKLDKLLSNMSARRSSMSVVKSPEGKVLGIITVEDILEELVGEIYDENDESAGDAV